MTEAESLVEAECDEVDNVVSIRRDMAKIARFPHDFTEFDNFDDAA